LKTLLIVYHSHGVKTARMAEAVERGARTALDEADAAADVRIEVRRCAEAGPADLLQADAVLLGTPENFGYMSGMMKDFLERSYYACVGRIEGRAYGVFVGAGQDGQGAFASIDRIVTGLRLRKAHDGVLCLGELDAETVARCEELGATFAAGLALGVL